MIAKVCVPFYCLYRLSLFALLAASFFLQAKSAVMFGWGPTSSGKTYTMVGRQGCEGLVPRIGRSNPLSLSHFAIVCFCTVSPSHCCFLYDINREICNQLSATAGDGAKRTLLLSFLEVYNEKVVCISAHTYTYIQTHSHCLCLPDCSYPP